jgi:hypothetical protein
MAVELMIGEAGRPPVFNSPEEIQVKIAEYFEYVKGETKEVDIEFEGPQGKAGVYKDTVTVRNPEPITITGLALYLGFESRQSFYDYEKREGYSYIIKRARMRVENAYEHRLDSKNPTGPIFALKNMGWTDRQEVTQQTTIKDERIDPSKLTPEQRRNLADIQLQLGSNGGTEQP